MFYVWASAQISEMGINGVCIQEYLRINIDGNCKIFPKFNVIKNITLIGEQPKLKINLKMYLILRKHIIRQGIRQSIKTHQNKTKVELIRGRFWLLPATDGCIDRGTMAANS